ncbi:MAG: outer membrane beta-barrel protein [Bacteroidota bacterium]|nr:outer membrane beta-barrel protein [Chitinophagaceae bacterium]QLH47246.1 MAG: outer membrane beta-barrel protein [Bacteroidota bacterium]
MKKLIIFSLMIVSALSVDAQRKRTRTATSQGNVVVRLGMGVNSEKVDPDLDPVYRETRVSFKPSVGYMVVDNLELGVNFGVSHSTIEDVTLQSPTLTKMDMRATDVNFGVYVQKYFPLNNWFAFYTSADLGLSTGSFETDNVVGAVTTPVLAQSGIRNGVGGSANFGFSFTPYNALALQADIAGLGVSSMKVDYDGANNTINTTNAGFNVWRNPYNLSLVWYFGRGLWKK